METLAEKQAALAAKHEQELRLLESEEKYRSLTGCEPMGVLLSSRTLIVLKPNTREQLIKCLAIDTAAQSYIIEHGNNKDTIQSPYRIDIKNGVTDNILKISFVADDCDIWIEIPIVGEMKKLFVHGSRGITDCEYHYFPTLGMRRLNDLSFPVFSFAGKVYSYFGGQKTAGGVGEIEHILVKIPSVFSSQ